MRKVSLERAAEVPEAGAGGGLRAVTRVRPGRSDAKPPNTARGGRGSRRQPQTRLRTRRRRTSRSEDRARLEPDIRGGHRVTAEAVSLTAQEVAGGAGAGGAPDAGGQLGVPRTCAWSRRSSARPQLRTRTKGSARWLALECTGLGGGGFLASSDGPRTGTRGGRHRVQRGWPPRSRGGLQRASGSELETAQ